MAERRLPNEEVVRQLVERALESREAGSAPNAAASPNAAAPADGTAATAAVGSKTVAASATGPKTVAIGADHGGFALKGVLVKHLAEHGYGVTDCGTNGPDA
ncbi:MAG TPA: RpiB/LacA/LacB family sugar-phosphate isomerase, partial [Candidatus Limnocylindrales bacterium]